jgi:hypothetical protein
VKAPIPLPSEVLEFAVVGFEVVFQQTPRDITLAPPSEVTFPPLVAEVGEIALTAVVTESTGAVAIGPGAGVDELDLLHPDEIKDAVMIIKRNLIFIKLVLDCDFPLLLVRLFCIKVINTLPFQTCR